MRKLSLLAAAAFAATGLASAANATVPVSLNNCTGSLTLPTPDAIQCQGYYSDNILSGNADDITAQQAAVAALGGSFNGDWTALTNAGDVITTLNNTNQIDFGQALTGLVIIGAHFGNITDPFVNPNNNGQTGNVTVFWLFNLTTPTEFITLDNTQGFSNAALYQDGGVPEPSTWAMMLLGFGATGIAIRRSRKRKALATQLA